MRSARRTPLEVSSVNGAIGTVLSILFTAHFYLVRKHLSECNDYYCHFVLDKSGFIWLTYGNFLNLCRYAAPMGSVHLYDDLLCLYFCRVLVQLN